MVKTNSTFLTRLFPQQCFDPEQSFNKSGFQTSQNRNRENSSLAFCSRSLSAAPWRHVLMHRRSVRAAVPAQESEVESGWQARLLEVEGPEVRGQEKGTSHLCVYALSSQGLMTSIREESIPSKAISESKQNRETRCSKWVPDFCHLWRRTKFRRGHVIHPKIRLLQMLRVYCWSEQTSTWFIFTLLVCPVCYWSKPCVVLW